MDRGAASVALTLVMLGCSGSDEGGGNRACQAVDVAFPDFTPSQAKNGEAVNMAFTINEGTPSTDCLAEVTLDCGGQTTSYIVGAASTGGISANLVLHCDQASAPVSCSYSYQYPKGSANQAGSGSGPTCEP
ncbi:MAG: hypothetical protein IPI67_30410 [Myxococcales bacterium]|nr:hypothetical protein [Myxococcales bacterium]